MNGASEDKLTCKGLQRSRVKEGWKKFMAVLKTGVADGSVNMSFRLLGDSVFSYEQARLGLKSDYFKRKIAGNGIETSCLRL